MPMAVELGALNKVRLNFDARMSREESWMCPLRLLAVPQIWRIWEADTRFACKMTRVSSQERLKLARLLSLRLVCMLCWE